MWRGGQHWNWETFLTSPPLPPRHPSNHTNQDIKRLRRALVHDPIPTSLRSRLWFHLLNVDSIKAQHQNRTMRELLNLAAQLRHNNDMPFRCVDLDVPRTTQDQTIQPKLRDMLYSYVVLEPSIQYMSGMSFVANVILCNLTFPVRGNNTPEQDLEDAFWCFVSFFELPSARGFASLKQTYQNQPFWIPHCHLLFSRLATPRLPPSLRGSMHEIFFHGFLSAVITSFAFFSLTNTQMVRILDLLMLEGLDGSIAIAVSMAVLLQDRLLHHLQSDGAIMLTRQEVQFDEQNFSTLMSLALELLE